MTLSGPLILLNNEENGFTAPDIEVVHRRNLKSEEHPCEDATDYNMTRCIKESAVKRVGCALPWNNVEEDVPLCKTLEQFHQHEAFYAEMSSVDQGQIVTITGCKIPCNYRQFKLVGQILKAHVKVLGFALH